MPSNDHPLSDWVTREADVYSFPKIFRVNDIIHLVIGAIMEKTNAIPRL
jgi:hypothetical protein